VGFTVRHAVVACTQFIETDAGIEYPVLGHPQIGAVFFQQFDVAFGESLPRSGLSFVFRMRHLRTPWGT